MTNLPPAARQRRDNAGLRLVGRGLFEGLVAVAALGLGVLLVTVLIPMALDPASGGPGEDVRAAAVSSLYAALIGASFGLVGAVLALVVLGVVASRRPGDWSIARAAWLAPAIATGAATALLVAVGGAWWIFPFAAVPAAGLTAWRVRHATARYATDDRGI